MTVHQFDPGTAGLHDRHDWWGRFYSAALPGYHHHDVVTDLTLQRAGVDHCVHLEGGGEFLADVKCRCTSPALYTDDVLLEVWSDRARRVPGWAKKPLVCHYVAYAWPQAGLGYLLPFAQLRIAYEANKWRWHDAGFRTVDARNVGYDTRNLVVPVGSLLPAMASAMVVRFDDQPKCLTIPGAPLAPIAEAVQGQLF